MHLLVKQITFLSHRISAAGSKPDPKNIEVVAKMKAPTTVKEVRCFLGMCGFYSKYVPSFAKIAAPLTNLIQDPNYIQLDRGKPTGF